MSATEPQLDLTPITAFLSKYPDSELVQEFVFFEKDRRFGILPKNLIVDSQLILKPVFEITINPLQFEVVKFNEAYFSITIVNQLLNLAGLPIIYQSDFKNEFLSEKFNKVFYIDTNIKKPQQSLLYITWQDSFLAVAPYLPDETKLISKLISKLKSILRL